VSHYIEEATVILVQEFETLDEGTKVVLKATEGAYVDVKSP